MVIRSYIHDSVVVTFQVPAACPLSNLTPGRQAHACPPRRCESPCWEHHWRRNCAAAPACLQGCLTARAIADATEVIRLRQAASAPPPARRLDDTALAAIIDSRSKPLHASQRDSAQCAVRSADNSRLHHHLGQAASDARAAGHCWSGWPWNLVRLPAAPCWRPGWPSTFYRTGAWCAGFISQAGTCRCVWRCRPSPRYACWPQVFWHRAKGDKRRPHHTAFVAANCSCIPKFEPCFNILGIPGARRGQIGGQYARARPNFRLA